MQKLALHTVVAAGEQINWWLPVLVGVSGLCMILLFWLSRRK